MSFSLRRVFANPTKSIVDIGTFGGTFATREVFHAKKLANNVTRVYASTSAGVLSGFATGGVPGAFAGGAAGFGRGVAAAVHGEDVNLNLFGAGAKYGSIVGGVTGLVRGAAGPTISEQFQNGGAAGVLRNVVVSGATKFPAVKTPSLAGLGTTLLSATTLLNSLHPGTSNVNLNPPANPSAGTGTNSPNVLNLGNPSGVPSGSPSSGSPTSIAVLPSAAPAFPWWVLAIAAGLLLLIIKKKRGK